MPGIEVVVAAGPRPAEDVGEDVLGPCVVVVTAEPLVGDIVVGPCVAVVGVAADPWAVVAAVGTP